MAASPDISFTITIFLAAWLGLYAAARTLRLERFGLEIRPLIFLWRTTKVNKLLDLIAQKLGSAASVLGDLSIALGVGMMAFGAFVLARNLQSFFVRPEAALPIFPAIPAITIRESLPFFLISIAVLILVHEFAHGVAARHEKIEVKSAGVMFLAIIPGGFVEPNEESFKAASRRKRLRVLAAGSSSNLVFGLAIVMILPLLFQSNGVLIQNLVEDGPAEQYGLKVDDIITSVDGAPTLNSNEFRQAMADVKVGQELTLQVKHPDGTEEEVRLKTGADPNNPERAIVGIFLADAIAHSTLFQTLFWMQFWSINLAIVNMLPIMALDGGSFLSNFMEKYTKQNTRYLKYAVTIAFLTLLGLNMYLSFVRFGLVTI
ncbi:MAG: site-2 protease family protein [Candidatus Bathyarchaeia archaeon]